MGSEKSQFDRMMEVARERLARHAPEELAQRAGVEYADGVFIVSTPVSYTHLTLPTKLCV